MASDDASKPPNLPPYPQMILAAISALDEKDGASKPAISKYMETTYGELPSSHASLLSTELARMKESGELNMVKNNYIRPPRPEPELTISVKRGRGRPRKYPKEEVPPGQDPLPPSVKRGRGRPPKRKDPLAEALAKAASGLPKVRGRPPKKAKPSSDDGESSSPGPSPGTEKSVKRGRGRPPKVKPTVAEVAV